jgi:3-dehydroquinate synthase
MIPSHIKISNIESNIRDFLSKNDYSKIGILVDNNSNKHCFPIIKKNLKVPYSIIKIKSGEKEKNIKTCIKVWNSLTELKFDRKSLLINLGGGVISDLGGFIAATYIRGIDFINIPTTLLSQVDASIGGKLGIDFNNLKNHVGLFLNPKKVFIDTNLLKSLPTREIKSGFAEVIKHCLIKDKTEFYRLLNTNWKNYNWNDIIKHSIKIKSSIVRKDPLENGIRKILNFGHTIGHGIESIYMSKNNYLLHGEAIAIGIICESYISYTSNTLQKNELDLITKFIIKTYKPNIINKNKIEPILKAIIHDKKNINNKIKMSLLEKIGKCGYNYNVNKLVINESIDYYNSCI